jgi:hypothetical protein
VGNSLMKMVNHRATADQATRRIPHESRCLALTWRRPWPWFCRAGGQAGVTLALLAFAACADTHYPAPAELPAIDTPAEEPLPSVPYFLYADASLTAVEAAHTRQAGRVLNERLGDEVFMWAGYEGPEPLGCDYVLVTRGEVDRTTRTGCSWLVELAEDGLAGDEEVVQILRALLVTIDGPHWEQS